MSRTRRRVSRALIVCLGVTLVLGLVVWLHKTSSTTAAEQTPSVASQLPTPKKQAEPLAKPQAKKERAKTIAPAPGSAVTQTPTVPATPVVNTEVATDPVPTTPATPTATKNNASGASAELPSYLAKSEPVSVSSQPIVDATAAIESGNMLEGRKILNAALTSKTLPPAQSNAVKAKMREVNQTIVFSRTLYSSDEFGGTYKVQPGDSFQKIGGKHEVPWELLVRINGIDPKRLQAGKTIKMVKGPFHAVVDKSDFALDLWIGPPEEAGSMYVTTYNVGLGADDSTPTGTWIVTGKLKNPAYYSPRGEGVFQPDDPKNPLGEYWLSLEGIDGKAVGAQSYGIHGTIEPDTIGKQASMGCIRLLNEDVERVYEMLAEGKSTVIVRE